MKKKWNLWLIIFAVFTLIALVNFNRHVTFELAEGRPAKAKYHFIFETTGAYTLLLLLPLTIRFVNRYPIQKKNLWPRVPVHILASMGFGAAHTLLMYYSRTVIYYLSGWGSYDYGNWLYRFPMEYSHQVITYWTIYGVVLIFDYYRESQEQKLLASRLSEQLTQTRLQALQHQLNPHFLFNTLNMISSTMYDDVKAADKMMANLSDLLRRTLSQSGTHLHSLEKELELIRLYIEIMKARFGDRLEMKWNIDPESTELTVPCFILQPIVENAIQYSTEQDGKAEIQFQSEKKDDRLLLKIRDHGPGLKKVESQPEGTGVGLTNTLDRLDSIYGDDYVFEIEDLESGGVLVKLDIPVNRNE